MFQIAHHRFLNVPSKSSLGDASSLAIFLHHPSNLPSFRFPSSRQLKGKPHALALLTHWCAVASFMLATKIAQWAAPKKASRVNSLLVQALSIDDFASSGT